MESYPAPRADKLMSRPVLMPMPMSMSRYQVTCAKLARGGGLARPNHVAFGGAAWQKRLEQIEKADEEAVEGVAKKVKCERGLHEKLKQGGSRVNDVQPHLVDDAEFDALFAQEPLLTSVEGSSDFTGAALTGRGEAAKVGGGVCARTSGAGSSGAGTSGAGTSRVGTSSTGTSGAGGMSAANYIVSEFCPHSDTCESMSRDATLNDSGAGKTPFPANVRNSLCLPLYLEKVRGTYSLAAMCWLAVALLELTGHPHGCTLCPRRLSSYDSASALSTT